MSRDEELFIEVWRTLIDFIPIKQRETAAIQYVQAVEEVGYDTSNYTEAHSEDVYLDKVLTEFHHSDMEPEDLEFMRE